MGKATSEVEFWVLQETAERMNGFRHSVMRKVGDTAPQMLRDLVGLEPNLDEFDEDQREVVIKLTDQEVLSRDDVEAISVVTDDGLGHSYVQPAVIWDNEDDWMVIVASTKAALGVAFIDRIIARA